jgi:aldose sugar dehydrogenase
LRKLLQKRGAVAVPKKLIRIALLSILALAQAGGLQAQGINAGSRKVDPSQPFRIVSVAKFQRPWAIAFLPDGRLLLTEKPGHMFLVTQGGRKTEIAHVPAVMASGQNGLLDVAVSPDYSQDQSIYITYVEPSDGGGRLVLIRARLAQTPDGASLEDIGVIWRQESASYGGQPGGIILFDGDGRRLFLTVGDRMQGSTAQNPDIGQGKLLRLNLDGSTPADNPQASAGGVRGQTWTLGHRNPYGLAFGPDGRLWLHEMGPKGGDELNLIQPGKNYGWPIVSNGDNYDGTPIPRHSTYPEFDAPPLYWNPVIAPAGLAFYQGSMFPQWKGSALIGALARTGLVRVEFEADGHPDEVDRWDLGARIRDVAVAPDGAVWLIEDGNPGGLLRLTPSAK